MSVTMKDWKREKLRYLIELNSGEFITTSELLDTYEYKVFGGNGISGYSTKYNIEEEILVIGRVGAYCGNVHHVDSKSWITDNALICRTALNYRFMYYALNMLNFNSIANKSAQPVITGTKVKNLYLSYPRLDKQKSIANFLDKSTQKIEKVIEIKKRQLEKLEALKKSIIHKAVTKGLDDTVAMKDSGIEWIGEIPEGWEVIKLRQRYNIIASNVDKKSYDHELAVELCNYVDVYYKNFITNEIEFMKATATKLECKRFKLELDDVIITKDSESPHDIAVPALVKEVKDNLLCGYHLSIIRSIRKNASGSYLFWCLKDSSIVSQLHREANGITRWAISKKHIQNSLIPMPSIDQQKEIVLYLEKENRKIDTLKINVQKQIEKLTAYKKSLIYEYVTGKKQL